MLYSPQTTLLLKNVMIGNTQLPVESAVKCLGIWWDFSSSSKISIDDRIHKARAAFFAHGELGAFQGQLNPLSSRSLAESCIFLVVMYGSESWTLNKTLLTKLESFQAEVGKRILQLPKFTSNTIPLALNWPSMRARILCSKISYLHRICNDQDQTIKSQTFNAIAASDVHSLDLVKQCKFLESHLDSLENLTEEVLSDSTASETCVRSLRKRILRIDRINTLSSSEGHPSLSYPLKIARKHGWMRLWDTALDHGVNGTRAGLALLKLLSVTLFSDRRCPMDDCVYVVLEETPLCVHFIECHTGLEPNHTPDNLSEQIIDLSPEHFSDLQELGLSIKFPF